MVVVGEREVVGVFNVAKKVISEETVLKQDAEEHPMVAGVEAVISGGKFDHQPRICPERK